ncbi:MAG: hypothetical protein ACREQB_02755 [Candidatus Binataceae bacterium]
MRLLLILGATIALAHAPPAALAGPRSWQPLVATGSQVKKLLGARIEHIEVLSTESGALRPIPFQIDERLGDGRFALPDGRQPVADDSPGIIDGDDELAMMISDLGERARRGGEEMMPAGAVELEVIDPLGGPNRYAYVASVEHPRRSTRSYVEYDFKRNSIETDGYRIGFTNQMPTDFALQERMGENRANLIDRFKVRISAKVLGYFHFKMNEDRLIHHLTAWHSGPIRVIRRIEHSVNLIFGIRSPEVASYNLFYRDYIQNPFEVRFPWIPRLIFGDINVRIALDFTGLAGYSLVWSDMNRAPLKIHEVRGTPLLDADGSAPPITWIAFRGNGRIIIQTLAPSPVVNRIVRRLYFRNDTDFRDPPERVPGENPAIGYVMTGWEELPSGTHHIDSLLIDAPADYSPELLLRELSNPPVIECRALSTAAESPAQQENSDRGVRQSEGEVDGARP